MITEIEIKNFKSISNFLLRPAALNLLTGVNSTGKSSMLQALLLLRQSYMHGTLTRPGNKGLLLSNGDGYVDLGTFTDVINDKSKSEDPILIRVAYDSVRDYRFQSELYSVDNRDRALIPGKFTFGEFSESDAIFADKFQYLSAERLGPQDYYPRLAGENKELGKDGRYASHFIDKYGNGTLPTPSLAWRYIQSETALPLRLHINEWMSEISEGIEVLTEENRQTNSVKLSYRYKSASGIPTKDRRPQNVGYGLTQALSLIVGILSSAPGDLIILENPEIHLHARAQSVLGRLIARAAGAGIQIFIETHSDHILNGILIACKSGDIAHDQIKTLFFEKTSDRIGLNIEDINILPGGKIRKAPPGFFDQYRLDIKELI